MADTKIEAELEIQTGEAINQLNAVQKTVTSGLSDAFGTLTQDITKTRGSLDKMADAGKQAAIEIKKGNDDAGSSGVVAGFTAVRNVLESIAIQAQALTVTINAIGAASIGVANDFQQLQAKIGTAKFFGGTEEGAKAINAALDQTLTTTEALAFSAKLFSSGFQTAKAQEEAALLAKALAAVGQTTENAIIDQLRAGEVTGILGDRYRQLNPLIQQNISQFEAQTQTTATAADRFRISAQVIQKELGGTIAKINDINVPDLFAQLNAGVREVREIFLKEFGPIIAGPVKSLIEEIPKIVPRIREVITATIDFATSGKKNFDSFVSALSGPLSLLRNTFDLIKTGFSSILSVFVEVRNSASSLTGPISKAFSFLGSGVGGFFQKAADGVKQYNEFAKELIGENTKIKNALERKIAPTQADSIKKNADAATAALNKQFQEQQAIVARRNALAAKEAADEQKGFQSAARRLVRNFSAQLFADIAKLGGTFAPVIGAQKQFFEQGRILSAQYGEGLLKIAKLRDDEIIALQKAGKLTSNQAKAAILLSTVQEAGALTVFKIQETQTAFNVQLRNSVSLLSSDQKIAQVRLEQAKLSKTVESNISTIRKANLALSIQDNDFTRTAIASNLRILSIFEKIRDERQRTFQAQLEIAKAERAQELNLIGLAAIRTEQQAITDVRDALIQSRKIAGQQVDVELISSAALKRAQDLKNEILELTGQVGLLNARAKAFQLLGDKEQLSLVERQVAALNTQIFSRQQLLVLARQQAGLETELALIQRRSVEAQNALQNQKALFDIQKQIQAQKTLAQTAILGTSEIQNVRIAASQALVELDQKTTELRNRVQLLQSEILAGAFSENRTRQQTEIALAATQAQIDALGRLKLAQQDATNAQLQGLTVTGQLIKSFSQEVNSFTSSFSSQIKGSIGDLANGVGGIISGAFERVVTGQGDILSNIGKQFLDVLAGMAAKLGAFFITTGIAQQFVPPFSGAGAIAGGVALLALAGALKGASSLISPVSTPRVSGGTGGSGVPPISTPPPDRAPGATNQRDLQPVVFNFAVVGRPWSRQNETQEFADFREWAQFSSRKLGTADPFAFAETMRGRR